jgi:acyl-CoA thioesterase-1
MGINVASDTKAGLRFADMIVDGHKTLESRNSDTLRPYVGKRVAIVRTGEGKAKAIGEVTVGEPKVVNQKQFRAMEDEHLVPKGSRFDINTPTKHLYPMHDPVRYEEERDVGHGIVSRKVIHKAKGGAVKPTIDQMRQALAKGGKVEVRPTVKDENLMRKIPQMEAAAKKVEEGKMSHEAYDKVVAKHKPVKPYEFVPQPASDEDADRALMENKKPHWRGHEDWPAGRKVGLRLDIPAYENHGVWVNSIHDEEGKGDDKRNTSYGSVSSVKNATFDAGPSKAIKVATGEQNKAPFARIKGELHHMSEDEAVEHMQKNLNHKDYVQVGMDPRRHGYFYDRKTMKPVTHAKHVVQIGPLVLAHKPTYGERETYAKGGKVQPTQHEMRQALMRKASGGVVRMAGGGILQDVIKKPDASKQLKGVVLSGASWLAGDQNTKLANQAFGEDVTNTAVGGYKTADVLNQLNVFERDGGTFAPGTTVVLDIGANDIATGVDPSITRANLDEIVSRLGESGVNIIMSAQPFANSFQEAIDNPNLVMNEMYSDIAANNPNVTVVDAMSGFLNQKNLMDESGFHLNNDQSKADYINMFADAYKANQPTQNVVDTTDTNTNPIGGLTATTPTNNVQDTTTQLTDTTQQSSPLQQAAVVEQITPEPIQQMSYKMPEYDIDSNRSFKNYDDYSGGVMERAKGGEVRGPFDYDNPSHVENVAGIAAKHRDFNQIPDAAKHLASVLSQGSYKFIEDPRIQSAIKQAGHNGYYIGGKEGKQQIIRKAEGGAVLPIEQVKAQLMNRFKGLNQLQSIGAEEAPSMGIKAYVPTTGSPDAGRMPVGGIDTSQGSLPVGGIDMSKQQPGHQLMPNPAGQQPGMDQVPMNDQAPNDGMPQKGGMPPPQGGSNILSMTPQGQAMAALKPQGLAEGGSAKSIDEMKAELAAKKDPSTEKRVTVAASGAGGVKGIVVPKHLIEGNPKAGAEGLKNMMDARAKVYGEEHREPLNLGQVGKIHKQTLEEHFAKPLEEQKSAEQEALNKIRSAKFIKHNKDTLDESEKLDTVEHEHDEEGRSHVGYASKGIAGHALFPKGHGKDMDYKVINTCPGQTEGCGGGKSAEGIVDTKQGTCFAPNAESQYAAAVSRRAGHAIAKHDPAMTRDWIIAHTGSMRNAANRADKQNKRMLYRPNVVDETDVSSRHVIRHLNEQRKMDDKPPIIANSYGKTNELHDPENGYHVTHSNVGPKVKKGQEITENVARDKARVRNTVMAADNHGDFKNEQGNKTPPKGSYMVTDVKRGSPMAKSMEKAITHAKYWSTGRPEKDLTPEEREEGAEGHFGPNGKPTTPEKAHYGHTTHEGLRYDYQKQHILHPRLVQVGKNDDGTPHMIPTDSRFKDTEFLPKNRFKTKNGKEAGHILMTTPTESTSNIGHQTSFTHNVSPSHIEHAEKNNGEYVIDKPEDQAKAKGKEYAAPQAIQFKPKPKAYAMGGSVGGRHAGFSDDDFHAFPEQNVVAQRHLAMRGDDHEAVAKHSLSDHKRKVTMNKDMDTMLLELTRNKKAK